MPTAKFDSKAESQQFELLPDGDYPFEVVGLDVSLRNSGKTAGSEEVDMKVAFYKDATFAKKVAQWTESLIFHESCAWKISVFTKCANMLLDGQTPPDGAELDYCAETMIGLRGWASVRRKKGTQDVAREFNYVAAWLTTKEKLPRNSPALETKEDDKLPF